MELGMYCMWDMLEKKQEKKQEYVKLIQLQKNMILPLLPEKKNTVISYFLSASPIVVEQSML